MKNRSPKADEILDVAEKMARTGGYNGFSFREIAKQVGIKAASVHYHFPGKDDLGTAVARRYADRFLAALGPPDSDAFTPAELLHRYVDAYRRSIAEEDLMCLCGMFGAEIASLPEPVAVETRLFFERCIAWLTRVMIRAWPHAPQEKVAAVALRLTATLEGALILARSLNDVAVFDRVTHGMKIEL